MIPQVLRKRVLKLAQVGHKGIMKMKEQLRSKVKVSWVLWVLTVTKETVSFYWVLIQQDNIL